MYKLCGQLRGMRWSDVTAGVADDTGRCGTFVDEHLRCGVAAGLSLLSAYSAEPPWRTGLVPQRSAARQSTRWMSVCLVVIFHL